MPRLDQILGGMRRQGAPSQAAPPPTPPKEPMGDVGSALEDNLEKIEKAFVYPRNGDLIVRRYEIGQVPAGLVFLDGLIDRQLVHLCVMEPTMAAELEGVLPGRRMDKLWRDIVSVADVAAVETLDSAAEMILSGCCALFVEGETTALIVKAQGFEKRSVTEPTMEKVVLGPHEGFSEAFRTNVTLVRKIVKTPDLVCETFMVGREIPTTCAVLYIDSLHNPAVRDEIRRRIQSIDAPAIGGSGQLLQWIEDRPNAILPQILMTERPDRAASFLCEGQAIVIVDGSPMALAMPSTFFHMMHTSDDSFVRWQYGTLSRVMRFLGLLVSIFLPGLYIAMVTFQQEVLPMDLLTAIAETHAQVPFPMLTETLFMSIALELIGEAGARIPSNMGSSLSIIGALILGQAAVSANVISPMLIIIVAITGLGGFCVPQYNLSVGFRLIRYGMILAGGIGGFAGLGIASFVVLARLCALESFGVPLFAPFAPRAAGQDRFIRMPVWLHTAPPAFYKTRPKEGG